MHELTGAQLATYKNHGLLCLPGILKDEADAARERILRICKKDKSLRHGNWRLVSDIEVKILRAKIKEQKLISDLSLALNDAINVFFEGETFYPRQRNAELLISMPRDKGQLRQEPDWHIDLPRLIGVAAAGVQIFTFLDHVETGGGGTVAVKGSHQIDLLSERASSLKSGLRTQLSKLEFFSDLFSHDSTKLPQILSLVGSLGGIDLSVEELTGDPGDVYLMDPWLVHTRFTNTTDSARLMVTQRYVLQSLKSEIGHKPWFVR